MCTDLPVSSSHEVVDPSINADEASQTASVCVAVAMCPRVFLFALIDDDTLLCLLLLPSFLHSHCILQQLPDPGVCSTGLSLRIFYLKCSV